MICTRKIRMRILSFLAMMTTAVMVATPVQALDFDRLLTQAFGSSDPKDLGGPIFALIGLFLLVFFWAALRIGRKRQRRLIQSYDEQLQEYSGRLRRGKN
tara:strand:+ start:943 stop:1242 length:300 start_codon:yes stop_codon:yes gene_type:complete